MRWLYLAGAAAQSADAGLVCACVLLQRGAEAAAAAQQLAADCRRERLEYWPGSSVSVRTRNQGFQVGDQHGIERT